MSEDLLNTIEEYEKEIERLNKLISQREKKWEKWTTEKQILSSKMSDYLCKYQNIKREYTKQIKISTDRKNEIERLNNIIKTKDEGIKAFTEDLCEESAKIEKAVEYIEKHTENIDRGRYYEDYVETYPILQILKGSDKEWENN